MAHLRLKPSLESSFLCPIPPTFHQGGQAVKTESSQWFAAQKWFSQAAYGKGWTGAKVVFAGHSDINADGTVLRPKWGPYEHMHPSEWRNEGDRMNMQSAGCHRANTSTSWPAQALVIRMMCAEKYCNHDVFFDYVDRWM